MLKSPAVVRHAHLDAAYTLHHVMVRGLERRAFFKDETHRIDFLARVVFLATAGAHFGVHAIPDPWRSNLARCLLIDGLAEVLLALTGHAANT